MRRGQRLKAPLFNPTLALSHPEAYEWRSHVPVSPDVLDPKPDTAQDLCVRFR